LPEVEWSAPGIVLAAAPFGEGDALATIFTEEHGAFRGLARGGGARARAHVWQAGNLVEARWVARLADQLGSFTAELVHPAAALAMQDGLLQATLAAACAVAEGALPEREAHPRVFRGLLHLIVHLTQGEAGVAALAAWELGLLADLGYGLDLSSCALTATTDDLAYVSPKTGRAVSEAAAGQWRERLLKLPAFLREDTPPSTDDLRAALRLTGHFLTRDAFGARHRATPMARQMLYDRVCILAEGKHVPS
jgi:DNA repair protein RecO (recombination protein O)